MNFSDYVRWVCEIVLLAWLAWLAFKPFPIKMDRMLFLAIGLILRTYFIHGFAGPLGDIATANVEGQVKLQEMIAAGGSVVKAEISYDAYYTTVGYLVPILVVVLLLMFWLQRALVRSRNPIPA
jgi:hypothetical protein